MNTQVRATSAAAVLLAALALPGGYAIAQAGKDARGKELPLSGKLVITGSSTMEPMVADLAKRFRARHPGVEFAIEGGGSGRGGADALEGKADIGMVSRGLNAREKALFAIPIARDGIAFVAHKDNPVVGLTRAQSLGIFTGAIADWAALGGQAGRIEAVTRGAGRGSTEILSHYLGIASEAIKGTHEAGENSAALRLVASNRYAIAFISTGAIEDAMQKGQTLKPLRLDGLIPSSATVRDGSWPLSRPLNLVTRRVPAGAARAFIEFALSAEAHPAILEHDYVPFTR